MSALTGATIVSWSPWKTIIGTVLVGGRCAACAHGGEGRSDVVRGAVGDAGMHAGRGIQVGIGRCHDGGHRTAGGEPGDVHAGRIDRKLLRDLTGDAGDDRRLAGTGALVGWLKPVPVAAVVGRGGLLGVGDQEGVLLGELVHAGAGGEVGGVLLAPWNMAAVGQGRRCSPSGCRGRGCASQRHAVAKVADLPARARQRSLPRQTRRRCASRNPGQAGARQIGRRALSPPSRPLNPGAGCAPAAAPRGSMPPAGQRVRRRDRVAEVRTPP